MTWAEVDAACRGYEMRLARSKELERFMAAVLINANRKKGTRPIKPEDIMPLVIDRRQTGPVELMSKEEFEKAQELFNKVKWPNQN